MQGKHVTLYTKDYGGEEAILATTGVVLFANDFVVGLQEEGSDKVYFIPWGSIDYMIEKEPTDDVPF